MCLRRRNAALPPASALAPQCRSKRGLANRRRRGLTLLELMLASLVMALFAAAISALAMAVQQNSRHNDGVGSVTQHARVAIQRIERAVSGATANEHFPGCVAFGDSIQGWDYPDTLVVWRGDISVADPNGTPLFRELVMYCPDPSQPNRLLEITAPTRAGPTPPLSDTSAWRTLLRAFKVSEWANKTELADRLRTVTVGDGGERRGAVRFEVTLRPSEKEWEDYKGGSLAWEDINWVQGMHGGQTGLRQAWCRCELQLTIDNDDSTDQVEVPFLGSASKYFVLGR